MMDRLTEREEIQMKLEILHRHNKAKDWHHRQDIHQDVLRRWPSTEAQILNLRARHEGNAA